MGIASLQVDDRGIGAAMSSRILKARLLCDELRNPAVRIVQIAENYRLGRARSARRRAEPRHRADPGAQPVRCPQPRLMRWMQKVHFSITPRERTVTSGLSCSFSGSGK